MSRGFNMWNYMTYHLVHDYFKAKKKKKTEIQNFEVKNYRNDHTWNDHRKILVDYIINSGTDGVWFSDFKAATGADADVRKLIPLGWVDVDECGEFWTCLGRCLKKCRTPQSKYDELTTPLQRFIAAFAFCGPLQSSVETIGTRFLSRASDGVERAMHAPPPKVDVWGSGSSMEHIQKMKVIWDHLLNSSDGGREIDDPQLLLSMLFAENRLELGTTAKEFVLDMANHGEAWKLVSQMMTPQGNQPPMFWQIAQIMSIKGNCKDELDNLIQEFMGFAYCFVSEIMKKYPNGGYDREKLLPYLKTLMPAEAPKN